MGIKETNTYVIRRPDEPAYRALSYGKLERDGQGLLVPYSKDDVVDVVSDLINNKELLKGDRIDKKDGKYAIYRFVYGVEMPSGKKIKYAHRVKVSKAYYEDNKPYTDRLEALVKSSHAIKTVNTAKMIACGVACTLMLTGFTALALNTYDETTKQKAEESIQYVEQINDERRENNCPPIGATYEDGTPFNGSYIDWVKYISGYTDKDGNVIDDGTAEPKTYQKSN